MDLTLVTIGLAGGLIGVVGQAAFTRTFLPGREPGELPIAK